MHDKLLRKYYFINSFDTNNIKKQDKETVIIYRNYSLPKVDINKILKLRNYLKKRGNKFLLSNNFRLALKLKLDGVYIPSFNKNFNHLPFSINSNFIILGSAHNLKEIRIKELQKVQCIFISSIFKKNQNYLGLNKFKIISKYTNRDIVALGGVAQKNLKKLNLIKVKGFAGISYFT
tara:strand:+ start:54 stop:584 length:531 start_codon:yes stop_codon:yes gene_type:complete